MTVREGLRLVELRVDVMREPVLEFADALAERASHLRELLRAEHKKDDQREDCDVPRTEGVQTQGSRG